VFRIRVALEGIKPPIWRTLLVPGPISLQELHEVLQTSLGWTDSHLHQFDAGSRIVGVPDPEFEDDVEDEAGVRLEEVMSRPKDSIRYEYDFGDGWTHEIVLEEVFVPDAAEELQLPSCIDGARACPPEDCGGRWGYKEFLKAIKKPAHPRHDELLEWVGGSFDPEHFDRAEVNRRLAPRKRRRR